jgi:hypothetical protein
MAKVQALSLTVALTWIKPLIEEAAGEPPRFVSAMLIGRRALIRRRA